MSKNIQGTQPGNTSTAAIEAAVNESFSLDNLERDGWAGFISRPWVSDLLNRYPELSKIASLPASDLTEAARQLFDRAVNLHDRVALRAYFKGLLELQSLSCQHAGALGSLCKRGAVYNQVYEMSAEWLA